jgi:hypothetical protein
MERMALSALALWDRPTAISAPNRALRSASDIDSTFISASVPTTTALNDRSICFSKAARFHLGSWDFEWKEKRVQE